MKGWMRQKKYEFTPWYDLKSERCVVGEGITTVGRYAFYWPTHSIKSVHLPDTMQEISEFAFQQNNKLDTLILPDGLERIGEWVFLGCHALTSIDIPESVTDLGKEVFYECRSATSIYVPGSIKEIKNMTFSDCTAVVDITISEEVEIIGEGAFQNIEAWEVVLPDGIKQINDFAFNNAKKRTFIGTNVFMVGTEKKFMLESENETAGAHDWTGIIGLCLWIETAGWYLKE